MLPKQLCRTTPAPAPRPVPQRSSHASSVPMDDADRLGQVFDQKLHLRPALPAPSSSTLSRFVTSSSKVDTKDSKSSESDGKASEPINRPQIEAGPCGPPALVNPPNPTEEDVIRETLKASLGRGRGFNRGVMREKHFYGVVEYKTPVSGTQTGSVCNIIPTGSDPWSRVGYQIRMKRLKMRWYFAVVHNNAVYTPTTTLPPTFRIVLKLTRVSIAPGTAEPVFGTDSNPPGTSFVPLSGLGNNPATSVSMLNNCVYNPASSETYELLAEQTLPPQHVKHHATSRNTISANVLATGQLYSHQPQVYTWEWDIPLDIVSTYDGTQGVNPITNALEHTVLGIFDANALVYFSWTMDLSFEDVEAGN